MITTTYKCDRCGYEQPDTKQMWWVEARIKHADTTYNSHGSWSSRANQLWCRACIDRLQLLGFPTPSAVKPPEIREVTFEEKLREIIRDEIGRG